MARSDFVKDQISRKPPLVMQITVRNQRVLRALGFKPSDPSNPNMVAGFSHRDWVGVIWYRIKELCGARPLSTDEYAAKTQAKANRLIDRLFKPHR